MVARTVVFGIGVPDDGTITSAKLSGALTTPAALTVTGVLTANGGAVFNEASADVDFRVESDGDTHALFVEGSSGNVGIGTVPAKPLHVKTTADGTLQRFSRSGICDWDVSIGNTPIITGGSAGDLEIIPQNANMGFAVGRAGQTGINMRVRDGTLTLGSGIKFNGDTAAANELSDYEEGGFSPAIVGGTQTITAIQQARYTKIGRSVTLNVYCTQSTVTDGSSLQMSGLPFNATTYNATGIVNFATNSSGSPVLCRTVPNATRLMFYRCDVNQLSITQTQNAGHIIFSITYITDQ
jgi:hypothetical protein